MISHIRNNFASIIGGTVNNVVIQDIEYNPDDLFIATDGRAGKPYLLIFSNGTTFQFRQFQEVINTCGIFIPANA
jgi:hypothetical protein